MNARNPIVLDSNRMDPNKPDRPTPMKPGAPYRKYPAYVGGPIKSAVVVFVDGVLVGSEQITAAATVTEQPDGGMTLGLPNLTPDIVAAVRGIADSLEQKGPE